MSGKFIARGANSWFGVMIHGVEAASTVTVLPLSNSTDICVMPYGSYLIRTCGGTA
jgi:hypothetical protein